MSSKQCLLGAARYIPRTAMEPKQRDASRKLIHDDSSGRPSPMSGRLIQIREQGRFELALKAGAGSNGTSST